LFITQVLAVSLGDEWLPMPDGMYYHHSCIHSFDTPFLTVVDEANFTTVQFTGDETNNVRHPPCPFKPVSRSQYETPQNLQYYSDWAADAKYVHSPDSVGSIGGFTTQWRVPSPPTSSGPAPPLISSSIYLFNGLEDGAGHKGAASVILQPVLQYGKSGCLINPLLFKNWYFTSYSVNQAGRAYCGPRLGPLQVGEEVLGNMTLLDPSSNHWSVVSTRLKTGESSSQETILGINTTIDAAYLTLEAMIIYNCKAYPSSGAVNFTRNTLISTDGTALQAGWAKDLRHTECKQDITLQASGDVSITWDVTA